MKNSQDIDNSNYIKMVPNVEIIFFFIKRFIIVKASTHKKIDLCTSFDILENFPLYNIFSFSY